MLPALGEKKISQITAVQVQKLYNSLHESGLADSTVRGIHMVLHEAMEAAGHAHLIAVNPTDGVVLPKKPKPEKQVLNDEQLQRFLLAIRRDPVWHDFFYTEITTGLRRGETCGLQWRDFDERTGRLSVRRSVSFAHIQADEANRLSHLRISEPKTETGVRSILLPPSTAELLRKRKAATGATPADSPGWIFPDPFAANQETPVIPEAAYRRLKAILKEAELPDISFHALRHTFATHALSSGVDAKTLSGILGHTQASFTLDTYTHVTTDMQKRASDTVGGFMEAMLGVKLKPWEKG